MNKTVELVLEWDKYEQNHRDSSIEEFCRYYLNLKREKREARPNFRGAVPPDTTTYLAKLIGRIYQIMAFYSKIAIRPISELYSLDDFYFLNSIKHLGTPRKSDVIHHNYAQLSSGIDVLDRIKRRGLIEELPDVSDKRAKLVRITKKGETVLKKCYADLYKVNDAIFHRMPNEDRKLCILLLKEIELRHSVIIPRLKTAKLAEIHEQLTGVKVTDGLSNL